MNRVKLEFPARSQNEGFARMVAAAYLTRFDPTLEELADVKTAVSEAVTNAIVHGYDGEEGTVILIMERRGNVFRVEVVDTGRGILDVAAARTPLYTSCPGEERSGMGFTVMETFMDHLTVESKVGEGTRVVMTKRLGE